MALLERLDVLENEVLDLVTKLKTKVADLNAINEAISMLHGALEPDKVRKLREKKK
jgi:hypothetical protein